MVNMATGIVISKATLIRELTTAVVNMATKNVGIQSIMIIQELTIAVVNSRIQKIMTFKN